MWAACQHFFKVCRDSQEMARLLLSAHAPPPRATCDTFCHQRPAAATHIQGEQRAPGFHGFIAQWSPLFECHICICRSLSQVKSNGTLICSCYWKLYYKFLMTSDVSQFFSPAICPFDSNLGDGVWVYTLVIIPYISKSVSSCCWYYNYSTLLKTSPL